MGGKAEIEKQETIIDFINGVATGRTGEMMIEEAGGGSKAAKSWRVEGGATFFKKLKF